MAFYFSNLVALNIEFADDVIYSWYRQIVVWNYILIVIWYVQRLFYNYFNKSHFILWKKKSLTKKNLFSCFYLFAIFRSNFRKQCSKMIYSSKVLFTIVNWILHLLWLFSFTCRSVSFVSKHTFCSWSIYFGLALSHIFLFSNNLCYMS